MGSPIMGITTPDNTTKPVAIPFGICSSGVTSTTKIVTISGFSNSCVVDGAEINVKFMYANMTTPISLNINSGGSKSVVCNYTDMLYWPAGCIITFKYDDSNDNGNWILIGTTHLNNRIAQISSATSGTSGSSYSFLTSSSQQSRYGRPFSQSKGDFFAVMNGDGSINSAHLQSPTLQSGTLYLTFPSTSGAGFYVSTLYVSGTV